ncbi:MAG: DinB family protein, partial [Thermomicrobiales bacterium]
MSRKPKSGWHYAARHVVDSKNARPTISHQALTLVLLIRSAGAPREWLQRRTCARMFAQVFLNPFLTVFSPANRMPATRRRPVVTNSKLKHQLVEIIEEERTDWEALLADVDPDRIDEPGVNGNWSFRDVTAHLLAWRDGGIRLLEAEARGEPEPPTPWPAALTGDDEINAWLFQRDRDIPAD